VTGAVIVEPRNGVRVCSNVASNAVAAARSSKARRASLTGIRQLSGESGTVKAIARSGATRAVAFIINGNRVARNRIPLKTQPTCADG